MQKQLKQSEQYVKQVSFEHYRYSDVSWKEKHSASLIRYFPGKSIWTPTSFGGETICKIKAQLPDGSTVVVEDSCTCSLKDNFNYKTGRTISYGRAMKKLAEIINKKNNKPFVEIVLHHTEPEDFEEEDWTPF